jgi:hypothetical protein
MIRHLRAFTRRQRDEQDLNDEKVAAIVPGATTRAPPLVFSLTGVKEKEYKIDQTMQRQDLAHPEGTSGGSANRR